MSSRSPWTTSEVLLQNTNRVGAKTKCVTHSSHASEAGGASVSMGQGWGGHKEEDGD